MRKFIAAASMSRAHLLKGKAKALRELIGQFLDRPEIGFNTQFGYASMQELLAQHGIENDDESLLAFIQSVAGDELGILCFQVGYNDYQFQFVSGSLSEIKRMMHDEETESKEPHYASANRNPNISLE